MDINDYEFELIRFNVKFLFDHATFKNGCVYANEGLSENAILNKEIKRPCHLFDQTLKEFSYLNIKEFKNIFVLMDFSNFTNFDKLAKYPGGFMINIDGKLRQYVMFLKSSSMSKKSTMLYVDKQYFEQINERVNFHYDEVDNLLLAKWFAYSGLNLTDAYIIDDLKLNFGEVCIVKDLNVTNFANEVVTAVSIPLILDKLTQFKETTNMDERNRIIREFACFIESKDFNNLSIKELISKGYEYLLNPSNEELYYELLNYYSSIAEKKSHIVWEKITLEEYPIDVNMFDGEGLIDLESANVINSYLIDGKDDEYIDEDDDSDYELSLTSYSFQIRLPFVKGVVHACNFKEFFKAHGITKIKGLSYSNKDKYYEYDVDKLKLILTESQFKASAIFKALLKKNPEKELLKEYFDNLARYDYSLAVSGLEPKESDDVKLCYQFLSTLPLDNEALNELFKYNIDLIKDKTSLETLISDMRESSDIKDRNFLEVYDKNKDFALNFSYLNKRRQNLFSDLTKKMRVGQLLCPGTRKILCGDLLALLYHIGGLEIPKDAMLDPDKFYCPSEGLTTDKNYILLRNPHYSRNEIVSLTHCRPSYERKQYFSHLKGVCMLNPVSFASERLGGADYDGDTIVVIKFNPIIKSCMSQLFNEGKYVYPVVKIPSLKVKRMNFRTNSYEQKVQCLQHTFNNFTGLISNIAFSKTYEAYQKDAPIEPSENIAFYTILGGLEIDSAKSGKKPDLEEANRSYEPPLFIKIKDHLLVKRKINKAVTNFYTVDKQFLESDIHDSIYKTYKTFKELKLDKLEYKVYTIAKPNDVDKELLKDQIVYYEALQCLFMSFDRIKRVKKSNTKSVKEYIINEVSDIFYQNGYSLDYINEFIYKFESFKPYESFNKYCYDNSYHFMNNEKDKLEYIEDFNFKLTPFDKSIITNFHHGGYKLLYLLLYFHKLPIPHFDIPLDFITTNDFPFTHINKGLQAIFDKDDINDMKKDLFYLLKHLKDTINPSELVSVLRERYEQEFEKLIYPNEMNLEDLNAIFNVFRENLIFSTYYPTLKKYMKEVE